MVPAGSVCECEILASREHKGKHPVAGVSVGTFQSLWWQTDSPDEEPVLLIRDSISIE